MRLARIQYLVVLSCLCILPASVYAADPCLNSCKVNVQGINSTYGPGEIISGTVDYSVSNDSKYPSRIQQIVIGIIDERNQANDVACIYDGVPKVCPAESIGSVSFNLKAPSKSGTYRVLISNYLQQSCVNAKLYFPGHTSTYIVVATIQISGSTEVTPSIAEVAPITAISSPTFVDMFGSEIRQYLPWIIISALLIAMFGVLMWRKRVPRTDGGAGLSLKTEINIVSVITLGLIIATIYVFFQQQFITYLIVIGITILIFYMFKYKIIRFPIRNGEPGEIDSITIDKNQFPDTLQFNGEYYQRDYVFSRKVYATSRVRELKRTGYFARVITKKGKQTYRSGTIRYGYTHAVYSRRK